MDKVVLHIEPESFQKLESQSIIGIIYFDFGRYQFPEEKWNDFIVVILSWWLSALREIVFGNGKQQELRFMDGPFYLSINRVDKFFCRIECLGQEIEENAEFSGEYMLAEVVDTVLNAARLVANTCSKKGWTTSDVYDLKATIKELEAWNRKARIKVAK